MTNKLALKGGPKVRTKSFGRHPIIEDDDISQIMDVLKSGNISTFAASPGENFLGGKKIKRIENRPLSSGFHTIEWDGRNEFGSKLANGVYIYKVNAKNNIDKTSHIGRCAKFK